MLPKTIYCGNLVWREYSTNDTILCRFHSEEWNKIASDVYSEDEWRELLVNNRTYILSWILLYFDQPVAMIYLLNEDMSWGKVSIHGGAWGRSFLHTLINYKGFILFLNELLNQDIEVLTSCFRDNIKASRFIRSVGFQNFHRDDENMKDEKIYFYITHAMLKNTPLYRKLMLNEITIDYAVGGECQ